MKKHVFVLLGANELNKEITSIGQVGNKLNVRIQQAALNAIHYSIAHGDIGFGQRLLLALTAGHRKNSLVAFLEKHGKFQWDKESKQLIFRKRDDLVADKVAEITEQWYEAMKEPEVKSMFDFEEEAARFLKRLEKELKMDATIKGKGMYDYVSAAIAQYHADQIKDQEVADEIAELMQVALEADEGLVESTRQPLAMAA